LKKFEYQSKSFFSFVPFGEEELLKIICPNK